MHRSLRFLNLRVDYLGTGLLPHANAAQQRATAASVGRERRVTAAVETWAL